MSSISLIRAELAALLDGIPGLRASAFYPNSINPPVAVVGGPEVTFDDDSMSDIYDFPVTLLASASTDRRAQEVLDGFCQSSGSSSVRAAINVAIPTNAQVFSVTRLFEYGTHEIQNVPYLGATFIIRCVAYQ